MGSCLHQVLPYIPGANGVYYVFFSATPSYERIVNFIELCLLAMALVLACCASAIGEFDYEDLMEAQERWEEGVYSCGDYFPDALGHPLYWLSWRAYSESVLFVGISFVVFFFLFASLLMLVPEGTSEEDAKGMVEIWWKTSRWVLFATWLLSIYGVVAWMFMLGYLGELKVPDLWQAEACAGGSHPGYSFWPNFSDLSPFTLWRAYAYYVFVPLSTIAVGMIGYAAMQASRVLENSGSRKNDDGEEAGAIKVAAVSGDDQWITATEVTPLNSGDIQSSQAFIRSSGPDGFHRSSGPDRNSPQNGAQAVMPRPPHFGIPVEYSTSPETQRIHFNL